VAGNNCLIGGTAPEARNIISGNGGDGNISLGSNSSGAAAVVQGNYIGTDVTGNLALTNPQAGISISGANNLIGGLVPGAQNVISGNRIGMQIGGLISTPPSGNIVQGNIIGLNALGSSPLPNSQGGINFSNASNNSIGGPQAEAANRISFNGGPGVSVSSGTGNSIRGNSISSNTGLGIDLFPLGLTANDSGDPDTGANNLQNFPVLTSVASNGGSTTIHGALNSTPNTTFQIDFYSNATCDPSGNGEGTLFFNTATVTTAGDGIAAIDVTFPMALAPGRVITSTATDPAGNTSEFSRCIASPVPLSIDDVLIKEGDSGISNATFTVTLSAASGLPVSIDFATANGTASAPSDYTAISATTLTFSPGEMTKTITVGINGDQNVEPDETFFVNLTNAVNATISRSQGVGTILNDDKLLLILDESGPGANQVAAFDSLLFVRDPFHVTSVSNWVYFGRDRNTRVIVFVGNLQLDQGESASAVVVNLVDANNQSFDVPAEDFRLVPNFGFAQVRFRLPDSLAAGGCLVTIKARGQISNTGTIRIVLP
jgi:hypothetical protein